MRSESDNRILNFRLFAKKILILVQMRYGIGKKCTEISDYSIFTPRGSEIEANIRLFFAIGHGESSDQNLRRSNGVGVVADVDYGGKHKKC